MVADTSATMSPMPASKISNVSKFRGTETPANLLLVGGGYAASARALFAMDPEGAPTNEHSATIYMLIGFSLELTLKAALLAAGVPKSNIRKLGHDLKAALSLCERNAVSLHKLAPALIELASDHHQAHTFRYLPDVAGVIVPEMAEALSRLRLHIDHIAPSIVGADLEWPESRV